MPTQDAHFGRVNYRMMITSERSSGLYSVIFVSIGYEISEKVRSSSTPSSTMYGLHRAAKKEKEKKYIVVTNCFLNRIDTETIYYWFWLSLSLLHTIELAVSAFYHPPCSLARPNTYSLRAVSAALFSLRAPQKSSSDIHYYRVGSILK